jgi:hypothetical protein
MVTNVCAHYDNNGDCNVFTVIVMVTIMIIKVNKKKVKLSRYTPYRRLGGEEV